MKSLILVLFALGISSASGQRVAPGVNPQHYQQPPQQYQQQPPQHQQQYQQHPQQYHQQQINQPQQVQYQQVPVQQHQPQVQQVPVHQVPVHQQVPVQQVPQGHNGGHHAPHGHHGQQQVLNAANVQHEREHIQEHMQVPIDTSKMSEAELQFHYFKMHDSDNNNKLDGCELIKSLIHWHADDKGATEQNAETKNEEERIGNTYTDQKLADVVDYVLNTMDWNKDGYVDYMEYRKSEEESAKDNKKV